MKQISFLIFYIITFVAKTQPQSGPDSGRNLLFNSASSTRVNIPDDIIFDHPNNEISIEAWIFPTNGTGMIFSKHETNNTREYDLALVSNQIRFALFDVNDAFYQTLSVTSITLNRWHHVAATYSALSGNVILYINGNRDITSAIGNINIASTTTRPLIGAYWLTNNITSRSHFSGNIDEIRLWRSARTETEIRENMCHSLRFPVTNLAAYYNFDESTGIFANEISNSNVNGILENFPASQISNRNFSGAPVGDESSYIYANTWTSLSLSINSPTAGSIVLDNINSATNGIHLFRVDDNPSQTAGLTDYPSVYFGTFITGGAITYDLTYDYSNSIFINNLCENNFALFQRNNNSIPTWSTLNSNFNSNSNTLKSLNLSNRLEVILNKTCTADPLPLSIVHFSIQKVNGHVKLLWETSSSSSNEDLIFEIERGETENQFQTIGVIQHKSGENLYAFDDYNKIPTLYRIKLIELDGNYSYSSILIYNDNPNYVSVFPNPSDGKLNISSDEEIEYILVTNSVGDEISNSLGCNNIDLSFLTSGIYYLHFFYHSKKETQRITIF